MRRSTCLTALLLALALFCAACGAQIPEGEPPAELDRSNTEPEQTGPTGPAKPLSPDPSQLPEKPEAPDGAVAEPETPDSGMEEPEAPDGGMEEPEAVDGGTGEPSVPEEIDYSGWYRDMQGTDVIYSELILSRQEEGNGLYDASIGLYRLTTLEGIAQVQEDGTLFFIGGPPKVQAVITIDAEQAAVKFTVSEFEYIEPGDVFTFPDGKA